MLQKCIICESEYNARGRVTVSNQPCFLCAARGQQYMAFYKKLKCYMSQVEDVSAMIDAGHDRDTIEMSVEFNLYIMRLLDNVLQYYYQWQGLRLCDIPDKTDLREKIEQFVLENYASYESESYQTRYNAEHRYNFFKDHCYFLFKPAPGSYVQMDAFISDTAIKQEASDDGILHEFNELFGTQFTNGEGFSEENEIPSTQLRLPTTPLKKETVFSIKSL